MVHQASVSVIPYGESLVDGTGMRCVEFDGITGVVLSALLNKKSVWPINDPFVIVDEETSPMRGISGTVLGKGLHGFLIVVDILRVIRRNIANPVQPESWYLPSNNPWRFPVVDPSRATLIARAKVQATNNHYFVDDFDDQVVEMQNNRHRAFLVVHWVGLLVGQLNSGVGFNISGYIYYNRE